MSQLPAREKATAATTASTTLALGSTLLALGSTTTTATLALCSTG